MHKRALLSSFCLAVLAAVAARADSTPGPGTQIAGDYVEIRSCDVYTGPCFANGEMNLTGREAVLAWSVRKGAWNGVSLDDLKVVAVVKAEGTLGDVLRDPKPAKSVLIVDARADVKQREALTQLARHLAVALLEDIVRVESAPVQLVLNPSTCHASGCSFVEAKGLVEIETRCLGGDDHVCGNEERFYPPLTKIGDARPAFTVVGAFAGQGLGVTFDEAGRRSAYLGTFSR